MTLSNKVYGFKHQQLINEIILTLFIILIIRYIVIFVLVCQCDTILYEFLLKIQPYLKKMRTILHLILIDFLRSRLSEFYNNFI